MTGRFQPAALYQAQSFVDWKHIKWYFANSEDPDEKAQKATFHQGLYYCLRQK